ncbi:hypothetical protein RRG08_057108, partial [Elysia crispata]
MSKNKRVPEIKFDVPEKDSFSGSYSDSDSVDTDSSTDVEGKGEADDDDDEEEDEEEYFDPNDGEPRWLGRVWVPHERFSTDFDFGSTKSYEAKLGYNFGKFLTGRRDLDRVCNMWHILFLSISLILVLGGIVLHVRFGPFLIEYIQEQPSFNMYSHFINNVDRFTDIKFSGYIQELSLYLIIFNSIYLACSLVYIGYPLHKFSFTMPLICLVCGSSCVVEMAIINISYNTVISQNNELIDRLQMKLKSEYQIMGSNLFSVSYDYFSIWFRCCGIVDHHDFQQTKLSTLTQDKRLINLQVAPTCCKSELFEGQGAMGYRKILECAIRARPVYQ